MSFGSLMSKQFLNCRNQTSIEMYALNEEFVVMWRRLKKIPSSLADVTLGLNLLMSAQYSAVNSLPRESENSMAQLQTLEIIQRGKVRGDNFLISTVSAG